MTTNKEIAKTENKAPAFVPPTNTKECVAAATNLIGKMMNSMLQYADKKYLARLQSVALSAIVANPKLMAVLSTPRGQTSFQIAVREAAEMGLLCDGKQASIVPFKGECKLMTMYQGMIEVAYRSKLVKSFKHGKVCQNDKFTWTNGEINHQINFMSDRGDAVGYWIRAVMPDGNVLDNFMTKQEVDVIRNMSRGKDEAPWTYRYDEMAYKTVLRNLYKWLPKTEAMDRLVDISDREEFDFSSNVSALPSAKGSNPFLAQSEAPKQIEAGMGDEMPINPDNQEELL